MPQKRRIWRLIFQSTLPEGSDKTRWRRQRTVSHFNPRSPKGATWWTETGRTIWTNFNPRSPKGATIIQRLFGFLLLISIHAPRRERPVSHLNVKVLSGFQSTLPEGSDGNIFKKVLGPIGFQSTLPEGSDVVDGNRPDDLDQFQSTLPEGSDAIHTPGLFQVQYFNPRSPKGATNAGCRNSLNWPYFNPRSPKGATKHPVNAGGIYHDFNPRSPKGATTISGDLAQAVAEISIHAPRRERPKSL